MQYVVQVNGEVTGQQSRTYIVDSQTADEAQSVAKQNFQSDYQTINDPKCVKMYKRTKNALVSLAFMLIPISLSLVDWKNGHDTIRIGPDYLSCLYAVVLYSAFLVRFKGLQRAFGTLIDIVFCVFNVLLLSTFVQTLLVVEEIKVFGMTAFSLDAHIILPVAIVLSWLGLKLVSLLSFVGIAVMAISRVSFLNEAMGNTFGTIYVICAFIGIGIYLSIEPAVSESINSIKSTVGQGIGKANQEISCAKSQAAGITASVSSKLQALKKTKDSNGKKGNKGKSDSNN